MNKRIFFLTILNLMISINLTIGQDFSKIGTSAAQFLKIPVGAKAIAMGGAYSAIADNVSSLYWNPSGIANINKFEMQISHTQWIAGLSHNFMGITVPIDDKSTIGFHVISLSSGDIERTTIENPKGTGTFFNAQDLSVGVSYARYLIEDISVGVNLKFIQERIWNTSAETVALDFGILLHTGYYGMTLGFSFQNFGPEMQMSGSDLIRTIDQDPQSSTNPFVESELKTDKFSLPVNYRASLAMPLVGKNAPFSIPKSSLLVAVDAVHLSENFEEYSLGVEYGFADVLFLRSGYKFHTDEEGLTLGLGLKLNAFSSSINFDYAYTDFGVFDAIHTFSIELGL